MIVASRLIARNTLANYAGSLTALAISFFLTPFLVRHLGRESFGIWALVGSTMAYGALFDLGVDSATVKYVSEHSVADDPRGLERVVRTNLTVYIFLGLGALVFSAVLAVVFPLIFTIPPDMVATTRLIVMVTGLALAVNLPLGLYNGILAGLQRHDIVNIANITWSVGTATAAYVVITRGGGLLALALVYAIGNTMAQFIRIGYLLWRYPTVNWLRPAFDRGLARRIFSFGAFTMINKVSGLLRLKTDEIVVGAFLSMSAVTTYYVGHRLADITDRLTGQFATALFPYGSRLDASGGRGRLAEVLVLANRFNMALAGPVALFLMLQAPRIIEAWMGPGFSGSVLPARLLALSGLLTVFNSIGYTLLASTARHQRVSVAAVAEAVANVILSVILVQRMGIAGVAWGTLIPAATYNLAYVLPHTCRRFDVKLRTILRRVVVPQLPSVALASVVSLALSRLSPRPSLVVLAVEAALVGSTYWLVYFLVGATSEERRVARGLLRR